MRKSRSSIVCILSLAHRWPISPLPGPLPRTATPEHPSSAYQPTCTPAADTDDIEFNAEIKPHVKIDSVRRTYLWGFEGCQVITHARGGQAHTAAATRGFPLTGAEHESHRGHKKLVLRAAWCTVFQLWFKERLAAVSARRSKVHCWEQTTSHPAQPAQTPHSAPSSGAC